MGQLKEIWYHTPNFQNKGFVVGVMYPFMRRRTKLILPYNNVCLPFHHGQKHMVSTLYNCTTQFIQSKNRTMDLIVYQCNQDSFFNMECYVLDIHRQPTIISLSILVNCHLTTYQRSELQRHPWVQSLVLDPMSSESGRMAVNPKNLIEFNDIAYFMIMYHDNVIIMNV